MFIQVKAIRKGSRPSIWRRAFLPLHITFSQMAFILEAMLELPRTDRFQFEFFQEKDWLFEADRDENIPENYEYSCWNSRKSCVDDWLKEKTWFTFRLRDRQDQPEYRVEVEKLLDRIHNGAELVSYPAIVKEVSLQNDPYWSDGTAINQILKGTCFLKEEKPGYPSFAEVERHVRSGDGIGMSEELKSHDHLLRKSTKARLQEAADMFKVAALSHVNAGSSSGQVVSRPRSSGQNVKTAAAPVQQIHPKAGSLMEVLNAYPKKDLLKIAEETGCALKGSVKSKMAYELARHLLDTKVMRMLLIEATEEELDAFEAAICRRRFRPSKKDWELLARIYNLNYLGEYTDDTVEVPWDAVQMYELICKNGYRAFHADARWLIDCLNVFAYIFVVGPVEHLFRMYSQRKGSQSDYGDFLELLDKIPQKCNPCRLIGEKLVSEAAMEDNIYLSIESRQRDVPYYLPEVEEIKELLENGYTASEPAYKKLYTFLQKEVKQEKTVCDELCRLAFRMFSAGKMISAYMQEVNARNIIFSSRKQAERFAGILVELSNNTRMFELRGHMPIEMRAFMPGAGTDTPPRVVPTNGNATESSMTAVMSWSQAAEEKAGAKKIYPNDPCPCGSGKKYKKCCGRKK